jgi:adenosylmethionine-8-amino-7-oxononanoate aminotransferase
MEKLWLPYQQMKNLEVLHEVQSARGVYIHLKDGRKLIDAIASWWCIIHGYSHPEISAAMIDQINKVSHVMLGGLSHSPGEMLAQRLVEVTPDGLNHVFFSDSGSVGVEVAAKMALQYWYNKGDKKRDTIVAFNKGYHGDTFKAMELGGEQSFHKLFFPKSSSVCHLDAPSIRQVEEKTEAQFEKETAAIERLFEKRGCRIAAVIIEPLVQCAGGFNMYSHLYIQEIRRLCTKHGILFILDEVATGFGRTGTLFAAEQAGVTPDIMILGKGLTAGYVGHAATLTTTEVFESFYGPDNETAFMHGPTFMGNPLACAEALKSLEIFFRDKYLEKIHEIEMQLSESLPSLLAHPLVKDVRVLGAIGVVEVYSESALEGIQQYAIERGVWIRPFERFLYTMPPYIIKTSELTSVINVMKDWFNKDQ